MDHPLDRPIWAALATRQAAIAQRAGAAVRLQPDIGVFAATADLSAESRAALADLPCGPEGLWLLERGEVAPPPGLVLDHISACVQMTADAVDAREPDFAFAPLGEADARQMLALARLCQPGPFFERTNLMGRFLGVKRDGRLVAMAGERLQPEGYTEVSGVCTHPDHRGRGYAGGLMRMVAAGIIARGEQPFLHSYASNEGANALYETLGFRLRRSILLTVLVPER